MRFTTKSTINHKIKTYKKHDSNLADLLTLHGEIFSVLIEYRDILKDLKLYKKHMDIVKKIEAKKHGFLLKGQDLNIDTGYFTSIFTRINDIVISHDPGLQEELTYYQDRVQSNIDEVLRLLKAERYSTDWRSSKKKLSKLLELEQAGETGETGDFDAKILDFILYSSLIPFYTSFTAGLPADIDTSNWDKGNCPICNCRPAISKLRSKDGARILHCWLCSFEWEFSRLKCPFCNNDTFNKLGYYYLENDSSRRVNVCDECKSYIKTISLKDIVGKELNLELENIYTLPLDYSAQQKGYQPGGGIPLA